jgi:transposase
VEAPSRFEISDELWAEVEPLIPARNMTSVTAQGAMSN